MSAPLFGILPFESTDSSIILKCSLLSAAAVAAPAVGPAGTITNASTARFDPVLGFRPAESGNSGIAFANATGFADLDDAGQVSFEISRDVVCALASSVNSQGTNPGGVQWTMTHSNGTNYGALRKIGGTPSYYQLRPHNASDTGGVLYVHSENKADMVRITYSWNRGRYALFVDGRPVSVFSTTPTRAARWSNQWQTINLMSHTSGSSPERDGYMRNFILSREPAALFNNAQQRVAFLGHSFSVTYSNQGAVNVDNYDVTVATALRRHAIARGYDIEVGAYGVAGGYWVTALSATQIRAHVATAMASRPAVLVLYGATNDVGSPLFTAAAFEADMKTDLGTIAAHAAMPGVRRIVLLNTPSRYGATTDWNATARANILAANGVAGGLPAWWDATYPAYAGRLVVGDHFNAWGGMVPATTVMVGQRNGLFTNLHPSAVGCDVLAQLIADIAL